MKCDHCGKKISRVSPRYFRLNETWCEDCYLTWKGQEKPRIEKTTVGLKRKIRAIVVVVIVAVVFIIGVLLFAAIYWDMPRHKLLVLLGLGIISGLCSAGIGIAVQFFRR